MLIYYLWVHNSNVNKISLPSCVFGEVYSTRLTSYQYSVTVRRPVGSRMAHRLRSKSLSTKPNKNLLLTPPNLNPDTLSPDVCYSPSLAHRPRTARYVGIDHLSHLTYPTLLFFSPYLLICLWAFSKFLSFFFSLFLTLSLLNSTKLPSLLCILLYSIPFYVISKGYYLFPNFFSISK